VSYLRPDELSAHLSRLSLERVLVEPDDLQTLGEIPHLVCVAKLRRQIVYKPIRCNRKFGRSAAVRKNG
jgi:hypothetical protein